MCYSDNFRNYNKKEVRRGLTEISPNRSLWVYRSSPSDPTPVWPVPLPSTTPCVSGRTSTRLGHPSGVPPRDSKDHRSSFSPSTITLYLRLAPDPETGPVHFRDSSFLLNSSLSFVVRLGDRDDPTGIRPTLHPPYTRLKQKTVKGETLRERQNKPVCQVGWCHGVE